MPKLKKITTNSTPAEKEKLVFDLIHWLDKRNLFMDIHIYANHKCWSSDYYDKTLKDNMSVIEDPKIAKISSMLQTMLQQKTISNMRTKTSSQCLLKVHYIMKSITVMVKLIMTYVRFWKTRVIFRIGLCMVIIHLWIMNNVTLRKDFKYE